MSPRRTRRSTKIPDPFYFMLVRLLIDPRFDGEESPNPNPQERDTHHQRHHTQCLNAGQLQPPHSRNTNNKNPIAVLMYDSSVRSFANSVRCRASRSRIAVSNFSGMGDQQILTETIPLRERSSMDQERRPGKEEKARARRSTMTPDPFVLSRDGLSVKGKKDCRGHWNARKANEAQTMMTTFLNRP